MPLAQDNSSTLPDNGRTTTTLTQYLANDAVYNVRDFGAVGDGVTDDTTAFENALAAIPAPGAYAVQGGVLLVPNGKYVISRPLNPNNWTLVQGHGYGSQLIFTASAGACLTLGTSNVSLNYKSGVHQLVIGLTQQATTAIRLRGTCGASLRDLYLEGIAGSYATRTNIGVDIDGANISSFLNIVDTVHCNHMHIGFQVRSTGTTYATCSTFLNCASLGDVSAGDTTSIGFNFLGHTSARIAPETGYNGPGEGSVIVGGNVERCGTGVGIEGGPVSVSGLRFESNTTDVSLPSYSSRNTIRDCPTLTTVSDSSLARSNNLVELVQERDAQYTATMSTGSGTITLNSGVGGDVCHYSKRGRECFVWGNVTIGSMTGVGGANVYITLPFTARAGTDNYMAGSVRATGLKTTAATAMQCYVDAGYNHLVIERFSAGVATNIVADLQNGANFIFSARYLVA